MATTETVIEVKELAPAHRAFPDVLNEWTDTLLEINKTATIEQVLLVTRLGLLGHRLISEGYAIGQNEMLRMAKERMQ